MLLKLLGAAVCCDPARQASIVAQSVGAEALRAVLDCMGWPHQQRFNVPLPGADKASIVPRLVDLTDFGAVHAAGVQPSDLVVCTYSSQLLLLRVLCELLHFHPTNIALFMQNGRSKVRTADSRRDLDD